MEHVTQGTNAGTEPGEPAAQAAPPTQRASVRPFWTRKENRVECSVWRHDQGGRFRYTISLSRSYLHRKTGAYKRDHYFDVEDMENVIHLAYAAWQHVARDEASEVWKIVNKHSS